MKTYYFHKTNIGKLFFEVEEETRKVTAFTMHCDFALTGTATESNHKGIWMKLPQICDAEMTIFLSNAKYQKLTCTKQEAFDFQNERREQRLEEIIAQYNERE